MGDKLQLISFIMANIAIVCIVVAGATSHWAARENDKRHVYEGLWKKVVHHKHNNNVLVFKPYRGSIPAKLVVTMMLLATTALLHFVIVAFYVYLMCNRKKYLENMQKYLGFMLGGALSLSLIAVIVYTTYYNSNYLKLQWSYAVCWGGIISYFTAMILQVIHIDKLSKEESRAHVKYTSRKFTGVRV